MPRRRRAWVIIRLGCALGLGGIVVRPLFRAAGSRGPSSSLELLILFVIITAVCFPPVVVALAGAAVVVVVLAALIASVAHTHRHRANRASVRVVHHQHQHSARKTRVDCYCYYFYYYRYSFIEIVRANERRNAWINKMNGHTCRACVRLEGSGLVSIISTEGI